MIVSVPTKQIMRTSYSTLLGAALIATLSTSCGREPATETERVTDQMQDNAKEIADADNARELLNERQEATRELATLREKLDARLIREEKRLADGIKDKERRVECENHIAELRANIARIDATVGNVGSSADTDWERVKAESRATMDSTNSWFDRQLEKIDAKTDADADKDGH